MFKLRKPLNVYMRPRLLKYAQTLFSSNAVSVGDNAPTLNDELKQNKIISEKFMKELPSIRKMNHRFIIGKPSKIFTSTKDFTDILVGEGQEKTPLTNVIGTIPLPDDPQLQISSSTDQKSEEALKKENVLQTISSKVPLEHSNVKDSKQSLESNVEKSSSKTSEEIETIKFGKEDTVSSECQPKSLKSAVVFETDTSETKKGSSVFIVSTKDPANCVDLSTAIVPLPLQYNEDNLILAAVVQDLQRMYYKTSNTINHWHLLAHSQGQLWYVALDSFFNQPGTPQNFMRQKVISELTVLKDKTSTWLCEVKEKPESTSTTDPKKPQQKSSVAAEGVVGQIMAAINKLKTAITEVLSKKAEEKKAKSKE